MDEAGVVDMVVPLVSTGFASYDQKLLAGIRAWRCSPFTVNGEPIPVCTTVSFPYVQAKLNQLR